MDIYNLYRAFWDYSFENVGKIKPNHIAIYSFAIEHCNRLGWKKNFGFPTTMVLEATGIKSYSVYKKTFDDLVEFGFFEVVEYSKNQYSSNIIALKENYKANCKAHYKALDKALTKHTSKHLQSTCQSIDSINKQYYNTTNNKETNTNEAPVVLFPDQQEEILQVETEIQKKEKSSAKKEKNKPAEIPTMEDFVAYGKENKPNVQISALELKFKAWFANGWRTGKDKEIKNWKATLLNTLQFLPENMQPSTNGRSITDAMDTYNLLKR